MIDIYFNDWHISTSYSSPTQQYDDLSQKIVVHGNVPEGWSWKALLQYGEDLDIIELPLVNDRPEVTLKRENLPFAGAYFIQLQGKKGDATRHTDRIPFRVGVTMSGDAQWPTLPTEFAQAEQRINEARSNAISAAQSAAESEKAAEDAADRAVETVGNAAFVWAEVDEAGHLMITKTEALSNVDFAINESGKLEVIFS